MGAKRKCDRSRDRRNIKPHGRIRAFSSVFCLFATKTTTHFNSLSSLLSSPQSCHLLVISMYKILRISPGPGGCSQKLLNYRHSRQSLNKCLIKPQQGYVRMLRWLMSWLENGNALKFKSISPKSFTQYVVVIRDIMWHVFVIQLQVWFCTALRPLFGNSLFALNS